MKKIIKNNIFGFIIGIIITSSVSVIAATLYLSNQVSYTPTDTTWNVDNVKDALDELHDATELINQGDATESDIMVGKTAIVNGKLITGTKLEESNHIFTLATSVNGSKSIDIKSLYPDEYMNFTNNNFVLKFSSIYVTVNSGQDPAENKSASASGSSSISYDSTTGTLSVSVPTATATIYGNTSLPAKGYAYADVLLIK